ncbi:hypothetical protein [Streptomyces sp. KL116D]|uniref:hypothetical protein n=1 Tax=Streptomyces sp. KL116D TaxID=3045152 RepID=UPI0035562AFD
MAAKLSGQRVPARTLPLAAVSDVAFKDASRLVNRASQIAFGGEPLPALTATTAASDPNTVLFRHKQRRERSRSWPRSCRRWCHEPQPGPGQRPVYAAADDPQTHHVGKLDAYAQRLGEEERHAAGRRTRSGRRQGGEDRGEKLAAKLDPSGERPDIVAAAAP